MILNKFYGSFLGGLYLELLLWLDRKGEDKKYLTPKQMSQIIRESSKLAEGTLAIKKKVNALVNSRTKEEYELTLSQLSDLLPLSEYEDRNSARAKYTEFLSKVGNVKKIVDVENATDRAKMIEKKIEATYELQAHVAKRNLLRELRKARVNKDEALAATLEKQYKEKYGR
jgi:hypothetical protein